MNEKASVSKELDAKHKKIIEGLLRLPENKLCADCQSKGPRWASVNLGIFICMQCSGIHRSLGVHISKVRSATLDTWLPEQVAFIQTMGNKRANSYWEAELPPNYDRVGIENFIRAKYEDKRWIPRKSTPGIQSPYEEEKVLKIEEKSDDGHAQVTSHTTEPPSEQHNRPQPDVKKNVFVVPKLPTPVSSGFKVQPVMPKAESQTTIDIVSSQPPVVDTTTDLFDMLSVDDAKENGSHSSSLDDGSWANFQSVEANPTTDEKDSNSKSTSGIEDLLEVASPVDSEENSAATDNLTGKDAEIKPQSSSELDNLFKDSTSLNTPPAPEKSQASTSVKSQASVKDDILNLFDKSNAVSPFGVHQQQLAFLAQQQALMMAAAKAGGAQTISGQAQIPNATSPSPVMSMFGCQIPGMALPGQQKDANNLSQVGNISLAPPAMLYSSYPTLSPQNMGLAANVSEVSTNTETSNPSAANTAKPSTSRNDYDFSSLTQGLFSKR